VPPDLQPFLTELEAQPTAVDPADSSPDTEAHLNWLGRQVRGDPEPSAEDGRNLVGERFANCSAAASVKIVDAFADLWLSVDGELDLTPDCARGAASALSFAGRLARSRLARAGAESALEAALTAALPILGIARDDLGKPHVSTLETVVRALYLRNIAGHSVDDNSPAPAIRR
jgi:hypothetical protein